MREISHEIYCTWLALFQACRSDLVTQYSQGYRTITLPGGQTFGLPRTTSTGRNSRLDKPRVSVLSTPFVVAVPVQGRHPILAGSHPKSLPHQPYHGQTTLASRPGPSIQHSPRCCAQVGIPARYGFKHPGTALSASPSPGKNISNAPQGRPPAGLETLGVASSVPTASSPPRPQLPLDRQAALLLLPDELPSLLLGVCPPGCTSTTRAACFQALDLLRTSYRHQRNSLLQRS